MVGRAMAVPVSCREWEDASLAPVLGVMAAVKVLRRTVGRTGGALTRRGEGLAEAAVDVGATDERERLCWRCSDAPDELVRSRPEAGGDIG